MTNFGQYALRTLSDTLGVAPHDETTEELFFTIIPVKEIPLLGFARIGDAFVTDSTLFFCVSWVCSVGYAYAVETAGGLDWGCVIHGVGHFRFVIRHLCRESIYQAVFGVFWAEPCRVDPPNQARFGRQCGGRLCCTI